MLRKLLVWYNDENVKDWINCIKIDVVMTLWKLCDFCNDGNIKHWVNCIGIVILIIILWEWCVCYNDEFVFRNDRDPLEAKCLGIRLFL